MIKTFKLFLITFLTILATAIYANTGSTSEPSKTTPPSWSGNIQFGGVSNTGNSTSYNYNGASELQYVKGVWQNIFGAQVQVGGSDSGLSSRNYTFNGQTRYFFKAPTRFVYGLTDLNLDAFSTYKNIWTVSVGYGRRIFKTKSVTIDVQGGPGYVRRTIHGTNDVKDEAIAFLSTNISWQVSNDIQFNEVAQTKAGHPNTFWQSTTSLTSTIIRNLALKLSYDVQHNTYIPEESTKRKRTDTATNISVVYSF